MSAALHVSRRLLYTLLAAPIAAGAPLGWLAISFLRQGAPGRPLSWASAELVAHRALYVYLELSTTIVLCALGWALGRLTDRLEHDALTDSLTGLHNRRYFEARLVEEMARARRHGAALALIVIDVDDFKTINDRQGHDAGDALLKRIAGQIRRGVRTHDIAARPGGDEFVVLLPDTDAAAAAKLCDRLRLAVAADVDGMTLSIGGGVFRSDAHVTSRDFFREVDRALYVAKQEGKNCVRIT